jgi:hypothetical protein
LDGVAGNISGPNAGDPTGCGSCISLPNDSNTHELPTYVWDDSIPEEGCVPQPGANKQFKFALDCAVNGDPAETDPNTTEECCRNVRLHLLNPGDGSTFASIPPSSCMCVDGSIIAIFSLEDLEEECGEVYTSGVCIGKSKCTQFGDPFGSTCDLAGATVTISQQCILSL